VKIRRKVFLKKIYHILMLLPKKRRKEFFLTICSLKIIFAGNLKQDSTFERFRKNKSYIEERHIELEDRYNAIIQKGLPKQSKDPWKF